ncbi:hypothetical protein JW823_01995 [bacterium]|nr:hypothetical protein [candidate division CSSED10-310 bacterium]
MNSGNQDLRNAIQRIVSWFATDYRGRDGLPVYDVDGETGAKVSDRNLLCEFDDYAPFFWVLGEHDYIEEHMGLLRQMLKRKGLLFRTPQIRKTMGLGLPGVLRRLPYADSQDYVEILYGLLELHSLTGEERFFSIACDVFNRVVAGFDRNGMLRSFRLQPFGPVLPVSDAMSGMFVEIACDMAAACRSAEDKENYLDLARGWIRPWLNSGMFREFGIFPSVCFEWPWSLLPVLRKKMRRAELAKPNASMAYGLMALAMDPVRWQPAIDAFKHWVDGLYKYFATADCVLTHFPSFSRSDMSGPILSTNFAILDILCDAVRFLNCEGCSDLAMSIARYFLKHQSASTHLVPDEPGDNRSYIDANSDFAVSLAKLTEITGDPAWRESGRRILNGIIEFHQAPFGYYRDVDLHTGKPLNTLVETRFCSLLLKPLILYRDELKVYDHAGHWSLFRDR